MGCIGIKNIIFTCVVLSSVEITDITPNCNKIIIIVPQFDDLPRFIGLKPKKKWLNTTTTWRSDFLSLNVCRSKPSGKLLISIWMKGSPNRSVHRALPFAPSTCSWGCSGINSGLWQFSFLYGLLVHKMPGEKHMYTWIFYMCKISAFWLFFCQRA